MTQFVFCVIFSLAVCILRWWCPLPPREMLSDFKRSRTPLSVGYLRSTDNNSLWPLLTFPCVNVKCAPLVFITFWFCWQALDHTRRYICRQAAYTYVAQLVRAVMWKRLSWYFSKKSCCLGRWLSIIVKYADRSGDASLIAHYIILRANSRSFHFLETLIEKVILSGKSAAHLRQTRESESLLCTSCFWS